MGGGGGEVVRQKWTKPNLASVSIKGSGRPVGCGGHLLENLTSVFSSYPKLRWCNIAQHN